MPNEWAPSSPLRTAATPPCTMSGASPPCFWETSWFQASDGDLEFAQWLLSRCTSTGEMMTLESVEAIRRLRILFRMKERLQLEFVRARSVNSLQLKCHWGGGRRH